MKDTIYSEMVVSGSEKGKCFSFSEHKGQRLDAYAKQSSTPRYNARVECHLVQEVDFSAYWHSTAAWQGGNSRIINAVCDCIFCSYIFFA